MSDKTVKPNQTLQCFFDNFNSYK